MKSREMSSQTCDGRGNGWRRPAGAAGVYLVCWHTEQEETNSVISRRMPCHTKLAFTLARVLATLL